MHQLAKWFDSTQGTPALFSTNHRLPHHCNSRSDGCLGSLGEIRESGAKDFVKKFRPDPKIPPPGANSPPSTNVGKAARRSPTATDRRIDQNKLETMMIRKLLKYSLAGGTLLTLMTVTPVGSYVRTGWNLATSSASDAVPLEWELKRARQMVADLQPEIRDAARQIAREKVQVARLERQLGDADTDLARSEQDIRRLRDDLARPADKYEYSGRTYTVSQVKSDLSQRFERLKTRQAISDKLQQMFVARQHGLEAATQRMEAMLDARRQLEVEIEHLQTRVGALRLAQTSSGLAIDDTVLSQTRELLDDIAVRIDVEEETLAVDDKYHGAIELDEPVAENLLDEVTAYLDGDRDSDRLVIAD